MFQIKRCGTVDFVVHISSHRVVSKVYHIPWLLMSTISVGQLDEVGSSALIKG